MAYKIPSLPNAKAYKEEKADFWEIQAICNPGLPVSLINISKIISKELDELSHDGIESEDDELDENLNETYAELEKRKTFSNNKYPFVFYRNSILFDESCKDFYKNIYLFLLLCTRFNMTKFKTQNGVDGTLLFEKLCSKVAKNYFGNNSDSLVFGTAEPGNFEKKVNNLIKNIGEGDSFKNPNKNSPTKNDDSIDIVVWKNFADKRVGKLIGFGQCKTGTSSWRDGIHKLKPSNFCSKWFHKSPVLNPIPMVFICDTLNEEFNFYTDQQGFLMFNRFRILEYITSDDFIEFQIDINNWLNGALKLLDIKR